MVKKILALSVKMTKPKPKPPIDTGVENINMLADLAVLGYFINNKHRKCAFRGAFSF